MTDTPSFNVSVFSPQSFEVADVRLIGAASLVRTRPYGRGASGFRNTIRLAEGMFASWAVVKRGEAVEERYDSSGAMKINLRLEGPSTIAGTGQDQGPYPITPLCARRCCSHWARAKSSSLLPARARNRSRFLAPATICRVNLVFCPRGSRDRWRRFCQAHPIALPFSEPT